MPKIPKRIKTIVREPSNFLKITDTPRITNNSNIAPILNGPATITPGTQPLINSSTLVKPTAKKFPWQKITNTAENIAPYASNIFNMFRSPVPPPNPNLDPGVTLQKVNMDNDRAMVERGIRGANMNADRTLDENTAQSVKQYNLAQRFNQLSQVNQSERNANMEIANRETELNSNITARNNMKQDQLGRDRVEMQLANQREKSANIANAADKYISIKNEKAKSNLDLKKFGIISAAYNQNGVAGRKYKTLAEAMQDPVNLEYMNNGQGQKENDIMDKLNANYLARRQKELSQKKYGGAMKYSTGGMMQVFNNGGIMIKPENKGKFTAWADAHNMGVQEAASKIMANKDDYSSTIVKRANFAKNASKWKH